MGLLTRIDRLQHRTARRLCSPTTARKRFQKQLRIEKLEDRRLLAGFDFPSFNAGNTGDLSLLGSASITSNHLRLTPALGGQNGAAWFTTEKQYVGISWESTFQFQLNENFDSPGGSDGFAFIIQNTAPTYLAGGGGTLGYDGLLNSLAVEFDTFQNSEAADPSGSHISVHTNGTGPNGWSESLSLGSYNTNPIMDDANVHAAKIKYTPGTLSVYLDNMTTPKLTVSVDLAEKLNLDTGRAWVGFTAATGGGWQNHDILNWNYSVLADLSTTVAVNDISKIEGNTGTSTFLFNVSRSGDTSATTTVNWTTSNGTATAGSDYTAASGPITFSPLETSKTIAVTVQGDTLIETHETFKVNLSSAAGGTIIDGVGIGTILNDDVSISIGNDTATEGAAAIRSLGSYVTAGIGGLFSPYAMVIGPDGKELYVSALGGAVYRFDAITGVPLPSTGKFGAEFVSFGDGGLNGARDIAFGPDGFLYVVSEKTDSVLRYDPTTGSPAGVFIAPGAAGLDGPRGLIFSGDYAYVTSVGGTSPAPGRDSVLRFRADNGAPAGVSGLSNDAVFIASGSGGLDNPSRMVFGPDGRAYVSSTATTIASATSNSILRYDPLTGAPAGVSGIAGDAIFVAPGSGGLDGPVAMVFRPDGLYVTGWRSNSVHRYQSSNGAFLDQVVASGSGGLSNAIDLLFESNGNLLVSSKNTNQILRYGAASQFVFTVSLSSASAVEVTVQYATTNVSASAGSDYVGVPAVPPTTLTFAPGETTKTIIIQTVDDTNIELAEIFNVYLSNPTGGVITGGPGVATIIDNDSPPTKFYVVNDGSPDRTYEYGATGSAIENYAIDSGNTSPRGAASNAAGDTVWVADKNRKVYVYDTSGGPLGSWSAGTLANSATVEGIATNGTDVWIVDSKSDKVFRYTGAATRTSGSQNADSSFSLNTSNKSAKGIVTDGTYLWVVDDSTTDKVFKYSALDNIPVAGKPAGTLQGIWAINSANKYPTGLTIDPSGASQSIWIVDSGTKKVYEYDNARVNSGGTLVGSFTLAAGNTNPQGIADPPAPGARLPSTTVSLAPASLSLAQDYDQPTPPMMTAAGAGLSMFDPRRDERASRVDQALVMPGSTKLQLRDSNVSAVPPVRSERSVRAAEDDAEAIFDDELLDLLAEAEVSRYQA